MVKNAVEVEDEHEEHSAEEAPLPVGPDLLSASDTVSGDQLAALMSSAPVNKPDISQLPDAFLNGRPAFTEGDKIVIERHVSFLDAHPYLDTKTYKVRRINSDTGHLWLWDEQLQQSASDNYKQGLASGCRTYKVAMGHNISTKKKRGRPRKNPVVTAEVKPLEAVAPKKRGRPPGSKNRAKEEIAAEKAEKRAARAAKRISKK